MPYSEDLTEITADKPLPGISAPVILASLLESGYCALGINMGARNLAVLGQLQVTARAAALQICYERMEPLPETRVAVKAE